MASSAKTDRKIRAPLEARTPREARSFARTPSGAKTSPQAGRVPARVRVRAAAPEDAQALAELRREAEAVHARLLPDYFRVSPAREGAPSAMTSAMDRTAATSAASALGGSFSVVLVAETQGERAAVVGYVNVKVVETPRDPAMTPRRRAHVETIVVREGHRGQGIGTALMRAASAWATRRAAAELVLTVWSDNRAAEALYRRLGYQPIARVLRRAL